MNEQQRAVVQQALEALEKNQWTVADAAPHRDVMAYNKAILDLHQLMQQPEPAAWVGLTDDDYPDDDNPYCCVNADFIAGARWAAATLRKKNGGA